MYHVMNRGDRREAIFQDDQDRQRSWIPSARPARKPVGRSTLFVSCPITFTWCSKPLSPIWSPGWNGF